MPRQDLPERARVIKLKREAGCAGDLAMVTDCDRTLDVIDGFASARMFRASQAAVWTALQAAEDAAR